MTPTAQLTQTPNPPDLLPPLVDSFGRVHESLRISVTDACNIRCRYCMPETVLGFLPQNRLLKYDSIARIASIFARAGVHKIRLTGGEPLMRPNLEKLIEQLAVTPGLRQIAMTTNAMLLTDKIVSLEKAGLTHINISLDTLRENAFREISRRDGLDQVLAGIDAAVSSRLKVRLNALVLREINLQDCVPLVEFARQRNLFIRFIEFMPLDADRQWSQDQVVNGHELRLHLETHFGPLTPIDRLDPSQPASDFGFADGQGGVGFIDPVSQPFCKSCNRIRLTADGKLRNCLFGREEWDLKGACETGASDQVIYDIAASCIQSKYASHGISSSDFKQPERAMYQIGG
ncbi:MAG: GTP 3',8-cyclase MoaA [Planctomycetota bacterium]|nr:GTP 3',8-cyclase MoaA [Planctomycetota bacterium]